MRQVELLRSWTRESGVDSADVRRIEWALEAGGLVLPGLQLQPFYDPAAFAWAEAAAAQAADLTKELGALDGQLAAHPETGALVTRGWWRAYFLWRGGSERTGEAATAPAAGAVTALAPGGGEAGNSYYSVLGPGTEIKAHTGRFNARLRCHVGLLIPDAGWIEVAGERRGWREGECLIFSDALPHHVVMDAAEPRAVFAFDFWHPDVTPAERVALSMLLTSRGRRDP